MKRFQPFLFDDKMTNFILSDPGPIIVHPCQSLTNELVEDLMNWPKYADYANYADQPDYADYADYAEFAGYAE